ncbi:hypothetical protein LC593_24730 [Nostoc sp. CHAB 5844]|nr:hypothetical protein [Nostoc sp. CHAB 5844]
MVQDQILLNDWHVIARSQDIQPGTVLHKRLLGLDLVLWHNGDKVFYTITPIDEDECVAQYWLMVNSTREVPVKVYLDIQNQVASQDIAIVESQQPRRLPLDLQAEVHLCNCSSYQNL